MDDGGKARNAENWHELTADAALRFLEATPSGLGRDDAAERLKSRGANRLPEPAKRNVLVRFVLHFHNILIYVLLGAAAITFALSHVIDTFVILAVVVANAAIGFVQEGRAEKALDAIRRMLSLRATVLRDGQRRSVDGEALVPRDIVLLEAGDKVPADLRLLHAPGLQIQEGILTGESVPVDKHTRPVARDAALGDRACMAFSGTLVTSGSAKGLVVATGPDTEIGRISGMLAGVEALNTLVVMEIFHLFFIRNIYGTSLTWRAARGTRVVWATVIAITAAQFAITYLTPLQRVFATEAVPFTDGVLIVGVGVVFFALIEVEKQLRLSFTGRAARPA